MGMALLWNQAYLERDTPWDKGKAAPPLDAFLERKRVQGTVLVPGCGTGHDARRLAAHGARVTGLDIAPEALRRALEYPSTGVVHYREGDFLRPHPTLCGAFDWLFEHTCLCALLPEDRPAYAAAAREVLKPGGHLLAVFFRVVPGDDGQGPPFPITGPEIERLFEASFETLEVFVPQYHFEDRPSGCEEVRLLRKRAGA